jgi:membrane protease YdiL (CAAX protease family)
MSVITASPRNSINLLIAVCIVLVLWIAYTALQTLTVMGRVNEATAVILGFAPGILGVVALLLAGMKSEECYLRIGRLSWAGLIVLAAVFVFALAAILPVGEWQGWSWRAALIFAPASGISQELFFRSALLPALQVMMSRRAGLSLLLHSLLFGLWHIGPLFIGAPIWVVIAVMAVPFLSGIGWGWQVQRDRTVFWAMIQHSLIWVFGLQLAMPG